MTEKRRGFETLQARVIEPRICTRCGTCVGSCPIRVLEIDQDTLWPQLVSGEECNLCGICVSACPQLGMPFDELNQQLFGQMPAPDEPKGVLRGSWVGRAADPEVWHAGAAGGLTSAIAIALLETGRVDGVFHCGESAEQPWKTVAKLSRTRDEILANTGSHYSTVPVNAMLKDLRSHGDERFALVGTGCHVQGLRKLQQVSAKGRRVDFVIGIFCGINLSPQFALQILEEMDITDPSEVVSFTHRWPGGGGAEAILQDGERRRVGRSFGHNMWRMTPLHMDLSCSMCVDYYTELADITVGDYQTGENVVFAHSEEGMKLIERGIREGWFDLRPVDWSTDSVRGEVDRSILRLKLRRAYTLIADRQARGLPTPDLGARQKSAKDSWSSAWNRRLFLLTRRVMEMSWAQRLAKVLPAPWQYWLGTVFSGRDIGRPWLLAGSDPIEKRIE